MQAFIIFVVFINIIHAEICSTRQALAFQDVVENGLYAECDDSHIDHDIYFHDENLMQHGAISLMKQTCVISVCRQAYQQLLSDDLVPNCDVELGNTMYNLFDLIMGTHTHCQAQKWE